MNTNRYSKRKVTPFEFTIAAYFYELPMADRAVALARKYSVAPGYIDEAGNPVPLINGGTSEAWVQPFLQDTDEVLAAWAMHPDALILFKALGDGLEQRFVYDGTQITPVPIP